jgi:hypothetical protein
MTKFAIDTDVPVERSRMEIEATLARYGADRFAYFSEKTRAIIVFEAKERRLKFELPLPQITDHEVTHGGGDKREKRRNAGTDLHAVAAQLTRARWRALALCIKAKLESVESGIETFESAFLANVVLPDGSTVGQHVSPAIARTYATNTMQPLLPAPKPSVD